MFLHHHHHHQQQDHYTDRLKPSTSSSQRSSSRHNQLQHSKNHHHRHHQLPFPSTSTTNVNNYQMSTTNQLDAVIIRNLTYEIGRGRDKKVILNKINLTVPEGSIYGLLGPSGCGKTTMLRCVVGRIKATRKGSVLVFGLRPGDGQSEVPGRDIGYMPQEISIYEDFTIEETLQYFGRINRMHGSDIKKRIEFLLQFLDLPSKKRLVVNLSGGQKRRVSLAAALVHSPPLLILDEPTVGVDPLLRQSIWKHLVILTQTERISVIITTHYIEEARQANVVGLMRHGKILAENSPDELMRLHQLTNLEDVFLKLCMSDSSRRAAFLAGGNNNNHGNKQGENLRRRSPDRFFSEYEKKFRNPSQQSFETPPPLTQKRAPSSAAAANNKRAITSGVVNYSHRWDSLRRKHIIDLAGNDLELSEANIITRPTRLDTTTINETSSKRSRRSRKKKALAAQRVPPITTIQIGGGGGLNVTRTEVDEVVENFQSESDEFDDDSSSIDGVSSSENSFNNKNNKTSGGERTNFRQLIEHAAHNHNNAGAATTSDDSMSDLYSDDYLAMQAVKWAARRSNALSLMSLGLNRDYVSSKQALTVTNSRHLGGSNENGFYQWWETLMAVTWKNYIRLRRNPPVLVFQFMLPAIQVILFCLCIGGEPFDVPVAIVNDEVVPRSSQQFLNGLNKKIIRQIKYDNLTSAMEAVRRGTVWGAIHIPDKYSQNLQSRLIMGEEVSNETISNGTIRVYPDLTNLHLALALETTFRETFINFARDSLEELGYDRSLADLPIQVGKPVYGTMRKDGYLEFMAPGVVISISYVMATGLTALAFILERRDGLLERSLVSGVGTSQILLAHAINQVVVMIIQIFLVLGCTFFVFEIPSRGPFFWVVLLILLQGCTGMGFGLLVSAVCKEENTAVMMLVGTFYTNLILAGIIWPIEAMPHWLRPLSYAQPQTLPTDTLRHILSRGWGINESGVLLGFAVTIGWLVIFLMAAGIIFKYSR